MSRTIYHGEIAGSTDPAQMPAISFKWGYLKANIGISGNVYIGSSSDVAVSGSTDTNTTGGLPLDAGDIIVLDMLPLTDSYLLSEHWYITDGATDNFSYYLIDW